MCIYKYRATRNDFFATFTPTDIITEIRFSVYALNIHHADINPDLVRVHFLRAGGGMSMNLQRASDTTIMKMGWWSSITFLMYVHNQIGNISKGMAQIMSRPIPFLNIYSIEA